MSITATELKNNLSYYIDLSRTEDILVTRNGKIVTKLSYPFQTKIDAAKSLFGSVPNTITQEEATKERLGKI